MINGQQVTIIAAMDERRGIGYHGGLPWPRLEEDIQFLKLITEDKFCVVGRKTYETLPASFKTGRRFCVLTTDQEQHKNIKADQVADWHNIVWPSHEDIYVLGGAKIYKLFLDFTDTIYLTYVRGAHHADAFMPIFEHKFTRNPIPLKKAQLFKIYAFDAKEPTRIYG